MLMEILVQSLMFKEMVNESSQWQLVVKDFKQQNKFSLKLSRHFLMFFYAYYLSALLDDLYHNFYYIKYPLELK
jgi:hypothetical protein